ncbi:MAG: D-arabinono-1,4-lactone oxidase [Rubripirellula sp.]
MPTPNFGRNITLTPTSHFVPKDEGEVLAILRQHRGKRIRCIGRLHSWSQILECEDILLDLRHLKQVQIDASHRRKIATVGSGCQIKRVLAKLKQSDLTLPSVGFITEQTIAGAISTGTHGSGRHSLSHYVTGIRIAKYDTVTGDALIEEITDGDELLAARCSLGCLGIILAVTIECRPTYQVEEHFQKHDDLASVLAAETDFPLQQFYLVPWLWTYVAQHRKETIAPRSPLLPVYQWYRFIVFDLSMHLLILLASRLIRFHRCIRLLFQRIIPRFVICNWRVTGDSSQQLVMEHERFRHVEIELFVQRSHLPTALEFLRSTLDAAGQSSEPLKSNYRMQLAEIGGEGSLSELRGTYCHHYPICVRRILPDETLISMACGLTPISSDSNGANKDGLVDEDWYSITLTNYHSKTDLAAFERLSEFLANSMSKLFAARPHWGKLCPLPADQLRTLYPNFERFAAICTASDPNGFFANGWTESLFPRPLSQRAQGE